MDVTALAFTLLLALITGIVFGLVPALQVPNLTVNSVLKEQHRGSTDSRQHHWIRNALVVSEIAFACLLMVGTGLLIRSFVRVLDVNLGFRPAQVAALRIDPSGNNMTPEQTLAYINESLRRVRELNGVEAAGLTDALPLGRNRTWGAGAQGVSYKDGEYPEAFVHVVTDGYLQAMGISLKAGRDFTPLDTAKTEPVVVINETLARTLWPGQNALGQRLANGSPKGAQVVGVVEDVRHLALEQSSGSEMYFPVRQVPDYGSLDLVVRSTHDPVTLTSQVRAAILPLYPGLPHERFRTMQQVIDRSVSPRRFIVLLLSGFACFALILASLGIYAVISYSVKQREQEIGIRMALGASPSKLRNGILLQTLVLAIVGMLIGAIASGFLTQTMKGLLFGVAPADPATFGGMVLVLIAVAAAAGYLPAWRASRIEPMTALRAD
jgi:predicted permease